MAKLDKIRFARLIGYIHSKIAVPMQEHEIEYVDALIEIDVPQPVVRTASYSEVDRLMFLMQQGTQKIEAIKLYRTMTGQGLKEAKDAVEKYWVSKPIIEKNEGATLGDILSKATK